MKTRSKTRANLKFHHSGNFSAHAGQLAADVVNDLILAPLYDICWALANAKHGSDASNTTSGIIDTHRDATSRRAKRGAKHSIHWRAHDFDDGASDFLHLACEL